MINIESLKPTPDERVMAALSHISALLPMIGVIAPIVIWVTQKEKSKYVAFQALQSLAYQLCMIAAWFLGMACYMVSFFGTFFTTFFASAFERSNNIEPILGIIFVFPFIVFGAIILVGFAFVVYGVIGAIMTFQGKPFRYAIIGKRVERFMQPKATVIDNQ